MAKKDINIWSRPKVQKENQFKHKIIGLKLLNEKLKGLEIIFNYSENENGHVSGILEGVKKMSQSTKKITNQDLMNSIMSLGKRIDDIEIKFEKRFEDMNKDMNKRLDGIDKRLDKMDAKIDLMIQTPTMNREIDHDALAKIDAS